MSKETAPAFQVYAADFMNDIDVQVMLPDELGAYWALLCFAWIEDGLPNNPIVLESLAFRGSMGRLTGQQAWDKAAGEQTLNERSVIVHRSFSEIWEYVQPMFYVDKSDGRLRNKRQEELRLAQRAKRPGYVAAGIKSGEARRKKAAERMLNERSTNVKRKPNTSTSTPASSSTGESNAPDGGDPDAPTGFKKPTVEQVKQYAATIGFKIDAEAFVNHYDATGWKVAGATMVDWCAMVRKWKATERKSNQGGKRPIQTQTKAKCAEDYLEGLNIPGALPNAKK